MMGAATPRRSTLALVAGAVVALSLVAGLCALGVWQLHRLQWKRDLIAMVDSRTHAAPVPVPAPAEWGRMTDARDAYRKVRVEGHFLHGRETLVQAVTSRGGGFWVLAPLKTDAGFTVLINRGFVPQRHDRVRPPSGEARVTGLLRMSEPGGGFLRANDPAANRWYSRDVAAIAGARKLGPVAPFFIDADATPNAGGFPIGGLTVVSFRNTHLAYAITWFILAAMTTAAALYTGWRELQGRKAVD